ncbi:hypothetical protein SRHO_G00121370 [Serrasalmus rhombeus]
MRRRSMEMRPSSLVSLAILCQVLLPHGCWCPAEARSCSKPPAQRLPPQLCAPGLWPPAPKDPKASPAELQHPLLPPPAISTMEESPISKRMDGIKFCLLFHLHGSSLNECQRRGRFLRSAGRANPIPLLAHEVVVGGVENNVSSPRSFFLPPISSDLSTLERFGPLAFIDSGQK